MSELYVPQPVAAVVRSINAGDTEAFLDLFHERGVVNDWGRPFVGRKAIRSWSDRELIGAKGVMTVRSVVTKGREVTVVGDWKSNHYTGPGRFIFRIEGRKVAEWRITGEQVSILSVLARVRAAVMPAQR